VKVFGGPLICASIPLNSSKCSGEVWVPRPSQRVLTPFVAMPPAAAISRWIPHWIYTINAQHTNSSGDQYGLCSDQVWTTAFAGLMSISPLPHLQFAAKARANTSTPHLRLDVLHDLVAKVVKYLPRLSRPPIFRERVLHIPPTLTLRYLNKVPH
jgi:hypothetical protein